MKGRFESLKAAMAEFSPATVPEREQNFQVLRQAECIRIFVEEAGHLFGGPIYQIKTKEWGI